jgi:hypothetical protein
MNLKGRDVSTNGGITVVESSHSLVICQCDSSCSLDVPLCEALSECFDNDAASYKSKNKGEDIATLVSIPHILAPHASNTTHRSNVTPPRVLAG